MWKLSSQGHIHGPSLSCKDRKRLESLTKQREEQTYTVNKTNQMCLFWGAWSHVKLRADLAQRKRQGLASPRAHNVGATECNPTKKQRPTWLHMHTPEVVHAKLVHLGWSKYCWQDNAPYAHSTGPNNCASKDSAMSWLLATHALSEGKQLVGCCHNSN